MLTIGMQRDCESAPCSLSTFLYLRRRASHRDRCHGGEKPSHLVALFPVNPNWKAEREDVCATGRNALATRAIWNMNPSCFSGLAKRRHLDRRRRTCRRNGETPHFVFAVAVGVAVAFYGKTREDVSFSVFCQVAAL